MKNLIQFELRKIFARRLTQASVTAILLLSGFLCFITYHNMYAFDGISKEGSGQAAVEIDKTIAEKYAGILTDEKVQQMMEDFKPAQDLHGMNAAYLYQNAMQSALFRRFSDLEGSWNGLSVSDVFGEEEIKIGYTYGWLQTSQNMVRIFLFLSLVIAIMTAPVFSGEYGGLDNIILTSKYGKTKCATAKIIGSILAALIVTAAVSAMNLILSFMLYGSSGLDCSILFAPADFVEGYIPFNITCGVLLQYQFLLGFTSVISATGITLALSALCKNQTAALVASTAIYLFPIVLPVSQTSPFFKIIALLPLNHAQFVSLMSVGQMGSNVLYALLAVPAALIIMGIGIVISHRAFARHQVT